MDALPYVDTLFKEYLLFRGFVNTLDSFNRDLAADPGCGFQADRITELMFRKLIPGLDCQQLVDFLEHLNAVLYSRLDSRYEPLVSAVEADLLRAFLVSATAAKRPDKVAEFFKLYGPQLLSNASGKSSSVSGLDGGAADWRDWFLLPYLVQPDREARFQVYFSPEWLSLLEVSFRNFLAGVMRCLPLPAVLRFNTDRRLRLALQQQVNALQSELDRAKQQVAEATAALQQQQQQTQELQQQQQQQADHQLQQQQFSLQHAVSSAVSTPVVPSPAAVASQHKLEASLGDWQQQLQARLHRHSGMPSQADSKELQQMHLGDRRGSSGLQSNGSGLFELLPMGQAVPATAGSAAAAAVQAATAGSFAAQQRHGHSRTASSGGISFDPEMVAAASGQAAAAADDAADSQPEGVQPASQPALPDSTASAPLGIAATAEPAVQPVQQAAGLARRGSDSGSLSVLRSSPGSSAAASPAAAGTLSSSPVMSWSGGMMTAGSSSGMRPRHTTPAPSQHATSSSSSGASSGKAATAVLARPAATAGVTPGLLLPGPLHCNVAVQHTQHQQQAAAAGSRGGVSCVAFSPTGANVASACSQGVVAIWSPPGVLGNANRHASVACGCPVSCVAWDARADKLMLIGCSGAGGVRAWHADTRRVMQDVAPEPGFPAVVAVAACPSEPTFVVAANNRPLPPATEPGDRAVTSSTAQPASGMGSLPLVGRLSCFNGRSFKRSAVLALPYEVGLASLAYSSNGSQLLVGTTAGSVLLYEPSSRSSPLRVWQVAAATLPGSNSSETLLPVQVVWQPGVTSGGSGTSTTSSVQGTAAAAAGSGSFFSMCAGMLCEWAVAGFSSRTPLAAVDVVAAAASSLASQQPANRSSASSSRSKADSAESSQQGPGALHDEKAPTHGSSHVGTDRQEWVCQCAVSPDGCQVVVIAGRLDAGVLLLYGAGSKDGSAENSSSSSGNAQWAVQPQVLLQGDVLAGGGCVAWHPALPVLVVGCAGSNASLAVTLS